MNRTSMRALGVVSSLAMIGHASATIVSTSSFEGTLGAWSPASDPESATSFSSGATIVPGAAHDGQSAVVLNADGNGPGGGVWLKSSIPVDPGTHRVTVSFWVYSCDDTSAASVNILAAVAKANLDHAADLASLGSIVPGLGWQHFRYTTMVAADSTRTLRVAMGMHRTIATNVKYTFDDVAISVDPGACRADFDNSGTLTTEDVFSFVDRWFAAKPECDFDDSGRLDTLDIFAFLNAWLAGCARP